MRKVLAVASLFSCILSFALHGLSKDDFDRIIDFKTSIKELSLAISNRTTGTINRDKFYIISGTVASIDPAKTNSFEPDVSDLTNPLSFISRLRNKQDALSGFIFDSLPEKLKNELRAYTGAGGQEKTPGALVRELKKILRNGSLLAGKPKPVLRLSLEIKDLAECSLSQEETTLVNRLILEEAYPAEIKRFSITAEVVVSEWIGYEKIVTYNCYVRFRGADSFKFANRIDPETASKDYAPALSSVLIIGRIDSLKSTSDGKQAWLLDGVYVRAVN